MSKHAAAALVLVVGFGPALGVSAPLLAQQATVPAVPVHCTIDLARVGQMEDILSNALVRGLRHPAGRVRPFLAAARKSCTHGTELLRAAAAEFAISEADLAAEVERFRHVNCTHGPAAGAPVAEDPDSTEPPTEPRTEHTAGTPKLSEFALDVTAHVVLHELGHALIREFDLPVLANEEANADAFATHYLTTHLPDRAVAVLRARVDSLMFEAREVERGQWSVRGEHNNDARRAYQIAALAVAADPDKYAIIGRAVGMTDEEMRRCADYGAEVHRSWRRVLAPLWMPPGQPSTEALVRFDSDGPIVTQLAASALADELRAIVRRFDWHSQVKVLFVEGEGGAGWSRSKRAVTVHSEYVQRFVDQGAAMAGGLESGASATRR